MSDFGEPNSEGSGGWFYPLFRKRGGDAVGANILRT